MASAAPNYLATGNVNPSVFVAFDTAKPYHVQQVGTAKTQIIVGIADQATYDPPGLNGSAAYAATDGKPLRVYGQGDQCLLKVGSGAGVTQGDLLRSDASGNAVTVVGTVSGTAELYVGARALESANASELVRVEVLLQTLPGVSA
jgi:hypothetical protein